MSRYLDIENWERKDHFHFFKEFEEPFFGVTVDIDHTKAYDYCKRKGISFFLFYLHKSLQAANTLEPFKYRIIEDRVRIAEIVDASPTIHRPNGTFGFSYMKYHEGFSDFVSHAKKVIEEVQNSSGLFPADSGENVIHYSSLPWIKFTALSHARRYSIQDSSPKISFGKMSEVNGRKEMPVSIHVHHALMDGKDVADYIDLFQKLMNSDK
jgi:chloramphenicol O-acetyltransferase type A